MRSRSLSHLISPPVLALLMFLPVAHAAVQDRIVRPLSQTSARTAVPGTVTGRAKHSTDLGAAAGDRKLQSLSLRFNMTAAQQADLTQLLAAQLMPGSAQYHQWLTPEQYGARFGLSSGDLAKISSWLTSQGFTVTETARSSTYIRFTGTVAQAQQAFATTIHNVSYNGEEHIANLTDPTLPSAVAGLVTDITGLNDFKLKPRSRARGVAADFTQTLNGTTSHYIAPGDLYTIYGFPPASSGITGTGVTIAVMGETDIITADVNAFQTAAGLTVKSPTLVLTGADPGQTVNDIDEAHIDVEWAGAAAPGATIKYVYGVDVFANSLTYAIDNQVAPIITISYGACETAVGTSFLASYNQLLAMANAEGITVIGPSGDAGATDCDYTGLATEGLGVDFPASSPYVTAAGGSQFSGDVTNPATYWTSTNGTNAGSATGYIPEVPWNETTATAGLGDGTGDGLGGGAAGGGASAFFAKPSWQQGTGAGITPADGARDVPDFVLNAAASHDGYVVCTSGSSSDDLPCVNGFLTSSGGPNVFGGTSFVAPTFAGILALVEQKTGNTKGLGNIGPILYGLANGPTYSTVFHDITSGNNMVPCIQGTLNCPSGGSIGYITGTGYDLASGLGSLNVANLISSWSTAVPTGTAGTTTTAGTGITTVSLTTTNSLCSATGNPGSLALTAAVQSAAGGATPTGTVQFLVDNAAVGVPVTLSSGTATYTLSTTGLSSGGHTVSAVYSGDGTYAGSKGTLLAPNASEFSYPNGPVASIDIVSATKADFSLGPCSGTQAVNVQPGATAAGITFTITPANGFTGTINLTAVNNAGMAATTSFSVSSVNITAAGAVTTSFVVQASEVTSAANAVPTRPGQRKRGITPWYAAGSGATLACVLLLKVPRRRRWGALLGLMVSVAALTAVGCSNSVSAGGSSGGGGTSPPVTTTTNATPGVYTFTVVASTASGLTHSSEVTVTVPCTDGTLNCLQ